MYLPATAACSPAHRHNTNHNRGTALGQRPIGPARLLDRSAVPRVLDAHTGIYIWTLGACGEAVHQDQGLEGKGMHDGGIVPTTPVLCVVATRSAHLPPNPLMTPLRSPPLQNCIWMYSASSLTSHLETHQWNYNSIAFT